MSSGKLQSPDIAITGFGSVDATGCGHDAMAETFQSGPKLTEVDRSAGYHRPDSAKTASLVDNASLSDYLSARQARRMSVPSRFGVVAAKIAWTHAGLEVGELGDRTSIVTSTCYGPSSNTEELLHQIVDDPTQASPFLFTEAVANAPAAQIALMLKAKGANITVTQRECGPVLALVKGAAELRAGRAERVLVASVDEANPLLHAVLDRFGVLAGSRGSEEVARPFDSSRLGFHLGEGATALVLESGETARRRGAQIYGWIGPWVGGFDPTATRAGYGTGAGRLAARLRRGLGRHDLEPSDFGLVVSGTSGGRLADEQEGRILRSLWIEESLPEIFVPKASTGEHGAGLLAGLVWGLVGDRAVATPGFSEVDPDLGLRPFAGGDLPAARSILVSALSVGGSAAWLVVQSAGD